MEFESFNRQLNAVNRHTSSKLVNAVQADVHSMLQQADLQLRREREWLEALKAVNPNIRDDELLALETQREQVLLNLHQANWRLDAIRLVVVSHQ